MLGSLLVGFLVGLLAAAITNRGERMGCIGKTLLGLVGSFIGQFLFGGWGPQIHDTAIVPSILGAMIVLAFFWNRGS